MCAAAMTSRAFVYSMGVPLALMHAPDVVNVYIPHCRCGGDAPDARNGRFGPAGMHVGAHEIKRTPNFDVCTHGSYFQSALLFFSQKIELAEAFPF